MIPPILEIYVVWHPGDLAGEEAAGQIVDHFHGTAFSGLIGGAVEVYVRSAGWSGALDSPRPLPFAAPLPQGVPVAAITAVVPVLGNAWAEAVQAADGAWYDYARGIVEAREQPPRSVGIFPLRVAESATDGTVLGDLFGRLQGIGVPSDNLTEDVCGLRCRDLAQGITQLAREPDRSRLTVFVSHTKRSGPEDHEHLRALVDRIRYVIANTRLEEFFDASDLQPGADWASSLVEHARTSALLAVRTDVYASREWCQREMATAKRAGMPVAILDALRDGEERGSFLMDHVPRVPGGSLDGEARDAAIIRVLNDLVDECLKRALWERQRAATAGAGGVDITWWAPHAPEPVTLSRWLRENEDQLPQDGPIRVLHPDPPLGQEELLTLSEIGDLAGLEGRLEVLTPRGLSARGA